MKNSNPHHYWSPKAKRGAPKRSEEPQSEARSPKGSILIWTLMLGFVLTSVFFFFAMRQRAAIAIERDTAAILNARTYVESYAGYLENLSESDLNNIKGSVDFDGIRGTITNEVDEIESAVDFEATATYEFSGDIYIEWNKCSNNLKGDLKLNDALYKTKGTGCTNSKDYDDVIGPISLSGTSFDIETMNAPFKYRITEKTGASTLVDNKWHMNLKMNLGYGNKVTVKRTF